MGHERNSELVQGLEMVTYRFGDDAPIRVGDKELGKLRHFSQELDSYIRRRFGQAT